MLHVCLARAVLGERCGKAGGSLSSAFRLLDSPSPVGPTTSASNGAARAQQRVPLSAISPEDLFRAGCKVTRAVQARHRSPQLAAPVRCYYAVSTGSCALRSHHRPFRTSSHPLRMHVANKRPVIRPFSIFISLQSAGEFVVLLPGVWAACLSTGFCATETAAVSPLGAPSRCTRVHPRVGGHARRCTRRATVILQGGFICLVKVQQS